MASRTTAIALDGTSEHGLWRVILASSVGTMIEWYDFYIFGSLAAVLSLKFYPPGNDTFAYIAEDEYGTDRRRSVHDRSAGVAGREGDRVESDEDSRLFAD